MKIPLFKPRMDRRSLKGIKAVIQSGKLSRGPEVEEFEKDFARYVGKRYAVAMNSGTSALHVAVRTLGWSDGDEIITTPFSYIASGNSILFERAIPVFVDIDPRTLNIDVHKIEEKITSKTKGILIVHILGLPVDPEPVKRIARKHGLTIIEDACEAIGGSSDSFPVGRAGDATVYGFHENKQLTTAGEGGMMVTDDPLITDRARSMRDQGRVAGPDWIERVQLGFNFRMTEVQAAYGRCALKSLDKALAIREDLAYKYCRGLEGVSGVSLPQQLDDHKRSWFLYFVIFGNRSIRDAVHDALSKAGIASSTNYFPPIYRFPAYKKFKVAGLPVTEKASETLLALPLFAELKQKDIKRVCSVIRSHCSNE